MLLLTESQIPIITLYFDSCYSYLRLIIHITPTSNLSFWRRCSERVLIIYLILIPNTGLSAKHINNRNENYFLQKPNQNDKFDTNSLHVHSTHTYACKYLADNVWLTSHLPLCQGRIYSVHGNHIKKCLVITRN